MSPTCGFLSPEWPCIRDDTGSLLSPQATSNTYEMMLARPQCVHKSNVPSTSFYLQAGNIYVPRKKRDESLRCSLLAVFDCYHAAPSILPTTVAVFLSFHGETRSLHAVAMRHRPFSTAVAFLFPLHGSGVGKLFSFLPFRLRSLVPNCRALPIGTACVRGAASCWGSSRCPLSFFFFPRL